MRLWAEDLRAELERGGVLNPMDEPVELGLVRIIEGPREARASAPSAVVPQTRFHEVRGVWSPGLASPGLPLRVALRLKQRRRLDGCWGD